MCTKKLRSYSGLKSLLEWTEVYFFMLFVFRADKNPDLKAVIAAGTAHGVLSLLTRHTERRLALGTLDIFLIRLRLLNVAEAHILKGIGDIGASGSAEQTQKGLILTAAHFDIGGEHAEKRVNQHYP